ncbi:Stemmadenine O-acetyltransferase [Linum grandiflorum]
MEVRIISKELVKPSSPEIIQAKSPHKFCLFDQLTPLTFVPLIQFYPYNDHHRSTTGIIPHTLNIYYPFSGRTDPSNLFVHSFNKGLPFTHSQVNSSLTHFLKLHQNDTHLLNLFLPRQPFQKEESVEEQDYPLMEIQVSVFSCGGIAFSWTTSHKLIDGSTLDSFITTLSAFARGSTNDVVSPNFSLAAELFPPRNPPPVKFVKFMESLWFTEADYVTRRFVFSQSSISRIRSSVAPVKLSRVNAVSCFIWQRAMAASAVVCGGGAAATSILVEAVNMRKATDPPLPEGTVGNVFWWATAAASPEMEMAELGNMVSEAVAAYFSDDYVASIQGEGGYDSMSGYFEQLEALLSDEEEEGKVDIVAFTSWTGFGYTAFDFGWGKPIWVAVVGKVGRAFRNLTVLVDPRDGTGGIEAWVTLDERRMSVVERDLRFLEFASPNPRISNL